MEAINEKIEKAARSLSKADAVVITAGAGIGIDSGLPDFRGNQGFWKAYPPIAKLGISFSEMANPQWFYQNPKLAWAFYGHRLNLYRKTMPHKGFSQLLKIAEDKTDGYFVFTSNVDGQFQKAGFSNNRIEECHGSIHYLQCSKPCSSDIWDVSSVTVEVDEDIFQALDPLPICIECGMIARPNILMFGDWNWIPNRTELQGRQFNNWLNKLSLEKKQLAVVEIGAGEAVPTVRYKSEYLARDFGAMLIRINPRDHTAPFGHISVPLGSAEGINRIYERINS